jgi:TRAP transporter TAXI family solute receptor
VKKLFLISLVVLALVIGACAAPAPAPKATPSPTPSPAPAVKDKVELAIYSARFGGVNYLAGVKMADLLTKKHPWIKATNLETSGSIENTKKDDGNAALLAKSFRAGTGTVFWPSVLGQAPLFDKKYNCKWAFTDAISLSGIFASTNPNIRKPGDLIGKKVAVGEKGSALYVEALFTLRDCWGIWDQIKPEYLGFNAAKDALMDGLIDVVNAPGQWSGGTKLELHPLMTEVIKLKPVYLISETQEDINKGMKATGWTVSTLKIPAGAFAPNVPSEEIIIYTNPLGFWAYPELSTDIVYEITKLAYDNISEINQVHNALKAMNPDTMAWLPAANESEVHPGALKFYKEKGMKMYIGGQAAPIK